MNKSKQKGFTLIELVMVIIVLSVIAVIASRMLSQGLNAYLQGRKIADANWQGQIGIERMTRDIRAIRSNADISVATTSQFTFVDITGTTVDYKLTGTNLMRNTQVLANGINSLTFTYYTKAGVGGATASTLRYVNFALNVTQNNVNFSVNTTVFPRDLT